MVYRMKKNSSDNRIRRWLIILFWMAIWEIAARLTDNSIILVGPIDTLRELWRLSGDLGFWLSVLNSLLRIASGFLLSSALAFLLGTIAYFKPILRELMSPVIALMKAVPVASFVILALIWLGGSRELSIVVSFIVAFPMIWEAVISGLSTSDRQLLEVSRTYEMGFFRSLRYIYLPALLPYLSTSLSSVIGMAFKSGVAAELIGQPTGTIGFYLYQSKVFLDTAGVFAWSLMVIMMSYICEQILKAVFKTASKRI